MRLSGIFEVPRVNLARYRELLQARLIETLKQAAVKYLQATAMNKVPVWSGASRATFSKLAQEAEFELSIAIASGAPDRIAWGDSQGVGLFETGTPGLVSFTYSTTLPHLIINEYNNANTFARPTGGFYFHLIHPGPYHFQEAGQQALREATAQIEFPGEVFDTTTIQVG
jgi:hypothetical protein